MSRLRRPDTLFGRLILAQALFGALALMVFAITLFLERGEEVGPWHAQQWSSRVLQALAPHSGGLATELADRYNMALSTERPSGLWLPASRMPFWQPFWQALQQDLARVDVEATEPYLAWRRGAPVLWMRLAVHGQPAGWLSLSGTDALPPSVPVVTSPFILLLVLAVASFAGIYYVRRITNPIERLRRHMHAHALNGALGSGMKPPEIPADAPVEIRDICADYGRLIAQLQHHERERTLLLAGVSHDLRSPLGRIRLAAELLPEDDVNRAGVGAITRNVAQADRLVGSFMDFVRVGALQLDEHVDLAAVVRQAVEGFNRAPHDLRLTAPGMLRVSQTNALLIDRLVFNLVDNAFKHGQPPVTVVLSQHDDEVVLDVVDQGMGLAAAGGDTLMGAFARGDSSRQQPGTGLGLAVVQQIVTRLQARLSHFSDAAGHTMRVVWRAGAAQQRLD